jgi:hypothetical protein
MPTLDIFNNDAFLLTALTAKVNKLPYVPGQVSATGLFEEDGVATTSVMVESRDGKLSMVEPTPRGGPGENVSKDKSELRSFVIPHYQRDDTVMADEVQGVRAFGTENDVETVENVVNSKMGRHTRDLDATLEFSRVGAIKGIVLSRNGNTLADLYTAFGIAAAADFSFALSDATTIVRRKCDELTVQIEDELDTHYTGITAFCGKSFWQDLINHKSVREVFLYAQKINENLGKTTDEFGIGSINFVRYRTGKKAAAANNGGGGAAFIGDDEARIVPVGVPDLFITRFAPGDYMETVNTKGLPRYAKQTRMSNDKGVNLEIQSNHISLCTQPNVLRKAVKG